MRHEKYNKDNKVTLRCEDFNPNGIGCCLSCHEDVDYDYPLCNPDHPLNENIDAEVCCGILNNELDETGEALIQVWEDALARHEKEFNYGETDDRGT